MFCLQVWIVKSPHRHTMTSATSNHEPEERKHRGAEPEVFRAIYSRTVVNCRWLQRSFRFLFYALCLVQFGVWVNWERYCPIQELKTSAQAKVRTLNKREVRLQFLLPLLLFFSSSPCNVIISSYQQKLIFILLSLLPYSSYICCSQLFTTATTSAQEELGHARDCAENIYKDMFPTLHSSPLVRKFSSELKEMMQQTSCFMSALSQGVYEDMRSGEKC